VSLSTLSTCTQTQLMTNLCCTQLSTHCNRGRSYFTSKGIDRQIVEIILVELGHVRSHCILLKYMCRSMHPLLLEHHPSTCVCLVHHGVPAQCATPSRSSCYRSFTKKKFNPINVYPKSLTLNPKFTTSVFVKIVLSSKCERGVS
jgi:hypothetical protein